MWPLVPALPCGRQPRGLGVPQFIPTITPNLGFPGRLEMTWHPLTMTPSYPPNPTLPYTRNRSKLEVAVLGQCKGVKIGSDNQQLMLMEKFTHPSVITVTLGSWGY